MDYADVHDVTFRRIRVEMDEVIPPPRYQYLDREPYGEVTPGYVPQVVRSDVLFHHEYSAGGSRRGKNRNLLFEDIHICGDVCPAFGFSGYSDDFGCSDIVIRNVYVNGKLAVEPSEYSLHIGEHCRNIRYEHDE